MCCYLNCKRKALKTYTCMDLFAFSFLVAIVREIFSAFLFSMKLLSIHTVFNENAIDDPTIISSLSPVYWLWRQACFNKLPLFIREFSEFHSSPHNIIPKGSIYTFEVGSYSTFFHRYL